MRAVTKYSLGITLLELMITVAIVAILVAVAYPSYISFTTESNRSEAKTALLTAANLQENFFLDNNQYATTMAQLSLSAATATGLYTLSTASVNTAADFTLTATAQGSQATNDAACLTLTLTQDGTRSGTSADCWD
ncbi:type IV pilin protein [Dongshaea marina]|uniref:type IV pilin protein n=1 Tax=Dongshaea marina TaxID=2047966 RepID=UPI000D3EAB8E|nr:type IV pilin protein [Dongshaea marina]